MNKQDENTKGKKNNICNDCAFYNVNDRIKECTHPLELGIDCSRVVFCSSFQPLHEVDSPCVTFDD
ncbi:MAG: hypothetical protein AAF378_02670 [Cyanobacteria bacterium P01_A01_bin.84]